MLRSKSRSENTVCRDFCFVDVELDTDSGDLDEAMILESRVLALNAPSARTVKDFRNWFKSKSIPVLWGRDEHLFENENDLVALAPVDTDRLNLFLKSYFAWFFKVRKSPFSSQALYLPANTICDSWANNFLCRYLIRRITHDP